MELSEAIYLIGYGVAFMMCLEQCRNTEGGADGFGIFLCFLGAILSWSLPIWYIGKVLIERVKDEH